MSVESSDQQQHALEGNIEVLLMLEYNKRMISIIGYIGRLGEWHNRSFSEHDVEEPNMCI